MMKRLPILFLGLAILATQIAVAQEDPPRYVNIFTAHTKLGHQADYETAVKKLWKALKETGGDFPVFATQSASTVGDYSFVTFLDSMADVDAQNEVFNKLFAAQGATLADLGKNSNGNTSLIIEVRPDLAYRPENPRVTNENGGFAHTTILYARPEHTQDLEALLKEFAELSREKGVRDGYGVSQNATGDGPVYRIRRLAESEADHYAQAAKINEMLGEEGLALLTRGGAMLLRIETSSAIRRTDLGYQP